MRLAKFALATGLLLQGGQAMAKPQEQEQVQYDVPSGLTDICGIIGQIMNGDIPEGLNLSYEKDIVRVVYGEEFTFTFERFKDGYIITYGDQQFKLGLENFYTNAFRTMMREALETSN